MEVEEMWIEIFCFNAFSSMLARDKYNKKRINKVARVKGKNETTNWAF